MLAVPPILVAAWIGGDETWQAWETAGLPPEKFIAADGGISVEEAFGTHHAYFGYALAWAAFAVALYAAARAVGWVLDGFLSSSNQSS